LLVNSVEKGPMPGSRDRSVRKVQELLERAGFYVTDAHSVRPTSFDLMARRDSKLVILKILKNIDALDGTEAERLRDLSVLFGAQLIVVGQTSGATDLESGVLYYRYGVPIVTVESLEEYLLEGVPPFLFSGPGGIFVRIDGLRLRSLREAQNLSLGALASAAGVSRRTIQLYEGGAGAEMEIVKRLEQFLQETIANPIDLLTRESLFFRKPREETAEPAARIPGGHLPRAGEMARETEHGSRPPPRTGDALRDTVFRHLDGMGWEVTVTIRCPFDAFTRADERGEPEILLAGVGNLRSAQHRAEVLHGLARVAEGHALFVVGERSARTDIDGMPVVSSQELRRHRNRQELLELIEERESE
jgi:putative transcriptional regulator